MEVVDSVARARSVLQGATARARACGHPVAAEVGERLFPMALPELIHSHKISPIHHPAHVANAMTRILAAQEAPAQDWLRGVTAALLHDIAFGRIGGEKKLKRQDLASKSAEELEQAINQAIDQRRSHMRVGSEIAATILVAYNSWFGTTFTQEDVREVCRLIEVHDNPSVQEYERFRKEPSGRV